MFKMIDQSSNVCHLKIQKIITHPWSEKRQRDNSSRDVDSRGLWNRETYCDIKNHPYITYNYENQRQDSLRQHGRFMYHIDDRTNVTCCRLTFYTNVLFVNWNIKNRSAYTINTQAQRPGLLRRQSWSRPVCVGDNANGTYPRRVAHPTIIRGHVLRLDTEKLQCAYSLHTHVSHLLRLKK